MANSETAPDAGYDAAIALFFMESEPMPVPPFASWMLEQEARALLTRLARVKPFMLQESMLPAAALLPESQIAIESFLTRGRQHLKSLVDSFLGWLQSPRSERADAEE